MPTVAVIVEGDYDKVAISALVKRCRKGVTVVARQCRGQVSGKFPGIVAELNRSYRLERVLVVSDAEGRPPEQVLRTLRERMTGTYRFPVIPLVIVEMLEAWLIADPTALEKVVGSKRDFRSPEKVRDPKTNLANLFSRNALYTPEMARRIVEAIDLPRLRQRCPRFGYFESAVLGN
jgi:hypothetical protein